MRLEEEIEIPVSAKTTMADEDKKFGNKETIDHFTVVAELPGLRLEGCRDLVLIQTYLPFLCKCRRVSITTTRFT